MVIVWQRSLVGYGRGENLGLEVSSGEMRFRD